MRKVIESIYFIITQCILLGLTAIWYISSQEIEALIAGIALIFAILSTLLFKQRRSKREKEISNSIIVKGDKNIVTKDIKDSKVKIRNYSAKS